MSIPLRAKASLFSILTIIMVLLLSFTLARGNERLKTGANEFIDYIQNHNSMSILDFIGVFSKVYDYHVEPLRSRGDLIFSHHSRGIQIPSFWGEETREVSGTFINQAQPVKLTKVGRKKNIVIEIPETISGYFIKTKDSFEMIFDDEHSMQIKIFFFKLRIDKAEATRQYVRIGIADFPDITKEF